MDRRRVKARSGGLHRGLQSKPAETPAPSKDGPAFSGSSRSSNRTSPRISNSEKLRRQARPTSTPIDSDIESRKAASAPVSQTPSISNSELLKNSKTRRVGVISESDDSDDESAENRRSSPISVPSSVLRKQKNDEEERENQTSHRSRVKESASDVLRKRKISDKAEAKTAASAETPVEESASRRQRKRKVDDDSEAEKSTTDESPAKESTSNSGRKRANDNNSDADVSTKRKSPIKESTSSFLKRRKRGLGNAKENDRPEEQQEKLLNKRKKFRPPEPDSTSDSETIAEQSPSKLRRGDPRIGGRAEGAAKDSDKASQSRLILSGRKLSLKRSTQKESNTTKLRKLTSPLKLPEGERVDRQDDPTSPDKEDSGNTLEDFLRQSGIILAADNERYQIDDDPPTVEKRMIQLLTSGKFKKEQIIIQWRRFIDIGDNLKNALEAVAIVNDQPAGRPGSNVSLVRIVLQIPSIQAAVSNQLLQKLNEAVLIADCKDDVPWATLLLQQFRFLEVVADTEALTLRLEELLETCPLWFQQELITFIPDIVIDVQHHAIAEMLSRLMETHAELTDAVLECITNLTLGKEYLEELRDKVLNMLKTIVNVAKVPAMARFVLSECPTVEVCQKVLTVIRSLELQPLAGEKSDEYYTSQSSVVRCLRMTIKLSKHMSTAAMIVVKSTDEPPKPMDLIILLLVYTISHKKKIAENTLKQHVKSGFYRASLLNLFYQDYREVAKDLQPEGLQLASNLLKSEDQVYVDFAVEWFRHQFVSQASAVYKQREIISKIILLMGNNDQTAKGALGILRKLTENDEEKAYLETHCNHLRILLEKIDNFDLQEVATLSDLLYALCTSSNSTSQALKDDLFILLQKQLSNAKTIIKSKGVLGAAMAIKHLAGDPESCKVAEDLFAKVEAGTKNCPRSQALFYDQIGRVIAETKNIDKDFLKDLTVRFEEDLVNAFMSDLDEYRGDLVSKFGLNDADADSAKCAINFGDGKTGPVVPAFFRLIRICVMRLHDGNLEDINMLLGCSVLLPQDMDIAEPRTLDFMICCINWFRELISAFVTQTDPVLQEQVLKRLGDLMTLQAEFNTQLTICDSRYQPPPCYFHLFPAPAFVKVEKKTTKKGKRASLNKSSSLPEWEAWEIGSTLCSKNPAYFRQMDAKVVDLLDLKMDQQVTQSPKNISKAQVCFLIRELLGMFESGEVSETLMRDLIHLLPKICAKLKDIVTELQENNDTKNRQVVKLILSLLTTIFNWKAFKSATHHSMLRDGLRTLAGQIDKSNSMLRSSKELVAESYKYFESLAEISTEISVAFALVQMCRTLMKHSDTFARKYKEKQAKMAYGFLCLQWPDDKSTTTAYKAAVVGLLANWIQNEPDPLETVTSVMEWLPEELAGLERPKSPLERLPTITKANFHHMFQKLFDGLISGTKISFAAATTATEKIEVWQRVSSNVPKIVKICKSSSRLVLLPFLRSMTLLMKLFMSSAIPVFEEHLRFHMEEVMVILKNMQSGTRYMNMVCVDSTEKKDLILAKLIPSAKQASEKLIYQVKAMLAYNKCDDAFWMGNLRNKNLEGQQILSQSSDDASASVAAVEEDDEVLSDVLLSDDEEGTSDGDA